MKTRGEIRSFACLVFIVVGIVMSGCAAVKVDYKERNSTHVRLHKGEGSRVTMVGSETELMDDVVHHFESSGLSGFYTVTRENHAIFIDAKYDSYAIYFYPSTLNNQTDVEVIKAKSFTRHPDELKSEQADAFFNFFPLTRINKELLKEGSDPTLKLGVANKLRWSAHTGNRKSALNFIEMGADVDFAIVLHTKYASSLVEHFPDPKIVKLHQETLQGIQLLKDLKKEPERREAEKRNEAIFQEALAAYRTAAVKPQLPEDARRYKVQAEGAVQDKDFAKAALRYEQALSIAPWWPEGHFNRALVLGEIKEYAAAIVEMKRYLALVPEAANARAAQDKIYGWEGKIQ